MASPSVRLTVLLRLEYTVQPYSHGTNIMGLGGGGLLFSRNRFSNQRLGQLNDATYYNKCQVLFVTLFLRCEAYYVQWNLITNVSSFSSSFQLETSAQAYISQVP